MLPGSAFGPAGEGYFRIALTVGADRLRGGCRPAGPGAPGQPEWGACDHRLDLAGLRRRGRTPWIALGISVVAHLVLLLFGRINGRLPEIPRRPSQIVVLAPPSEGPREFPMVFRLGEEPNGRRGRGPLRVPHCRGRTPRHRSWWRSARPGPPWSTWTQALLPRPHGPPP